MVIGECVTCDHTFMLSVPDRTPAYIKHDCEECGETMWTKLSRIDPKSWTAKEFNKTHEIDYENNIITKK